MNRATNAQIEFAYPFRAARQPEGGYTITFRDLPEAISQAEEGEPLAAIAGDCLSEALAGRLELGEEIPRPSNPRRGELLALPDTNMELKIEFNRAFALAGITQAELARRMKVTPLVVRRMLDPHHNSHVQQDDAALHALGKQIVRTVEIRDLAFPGGLES
jgi:antitoxin HicB